MSVTCKIQIYNSTTIDLLIKLNNHIIIPNLTLSSISTSFDITPGIHSIQFENQHSHEILFIKKLVIVANQEIVIFPLQNHQCISILKPELPPYNEVNLQFLNLIHTPINYFLSLTNGDHLFEDISFKQISNPLTVFPMTINLEIRDTHRILRKLPKMNLKPNHSYLIIVSQKSFEIDILNWS